MSRDGQEQVEQRPMVGAEFRPCCFQLTDDSRFVAADHRWFGTDDRATIPEAKARGNFDTELGSFNGVEPQERTIFIPVTSIRFYEAVSK